MTDDNTLCYMRQRYYNPQIKRFINQDILTGSIANSSSLNRYSYVEGNPISYTDPFGLSPFSYISEPLHNTLDWFGMIPFIGAGFDLINATIYLMEGEPAYALFAAFSSIGIGDGVKFVIKNGKKALAGLTITGLFCQTDAGATLKMEISGLTQEYITYHGYDQMSKGELALSLTMDLVFGAKSGYDDLNIKKKNVDVDVDDFVPDNATNKVNKIDGDDLIQTKNVTSNSTTKPKPHGNSKNSPNKNHVYVIVNEKGDMLKVGVSGQTLNKNGTSPRANPQVSKLNKNGLNTHAVIIETDLTRTEALALEQKITDKHAARNGGLMPSQYHKRPVARVSSIDEYISLYGESPNKSSGGRY